MSLLSVKERLRCLLALESAQFRLYQSQQRQVSDPTLYRALGHFAEVEVGHAANLAQMMEAYDIKPSAIIKIAQSLGAWVGQVSDVLGVDAMLKLNICFEQMASRGYRQLIAGVSDQALLGLLWKLMIDEEMHRTWFESTLLKLNNSNSRKK